MIAFGITVEHHFGHKSIDDILSKFDEIVNRVHVGNRTVLL